MSDCDIHWSKTFSPNMSTSLLVTRYLLPSSKPTVADCALLCLDLTPCQTAIFNSQMGTCTMFSEGLDSGGQLASASSNAVTTINMNKNASLSNNFIGINNTVFPVWNVTAGKNSVPVVPGYGIGDYYPASPPSYIFDGDLSTAFCMYGFCNISSSDITCGQNTGVYVTAQKGFILQAFCLASGNYDSSRDPLAVTIEGSTQSGSALTLGSSWTLLYNGTSGLSTDPGRSMLGITQAIGINVLAFASYRFLVVQKRSASSCVEFGELQLFGY